MTSTATAEGGGRTDTPLEDIEGSGAAGVARCRLQRPPRRSLGRQMGGLRTPGNKVGNMPHSGPEQSLNQNMLPCTEQHHFYVVKGFLGFWQFDFPESSFLPALSDEPHN